MPCTLQSPLASKLVTCAGRRPNLLTIAPSTELSRRCPQCPTFPPQLLTTLTPSSCPLPQRPSVTYTEPLVVVPNGLPQILPSIIIKGLPTFSPLPRLHGINLPPFSSGIAPFTQIDVVREAQALAVQPTIVGIAMMMR